MKKIFAFMMSVIMFITCFGALTVQATGAEEITPYYNNTNTAYVSFNISSSGTATVIINCSGKSGVAQSITARSYIQRKVGLIWVKVDNGLTNDEWVDYRTGSILNASHSLQLSKKDDYRVKVEITVSGTGGSADVIEKVVTASYV